MCVPAIIDASAFNLVTSRSCFELRKWIKRRDGIVIYSEKGKYWTELRKYPEFFNLLFSYRTANLAKPVSNVALKEAYIYFNNTNVTPISNDKHILALAKASNASVLCANDKNLEKDFKNSKLIPKSYGRSRSVYPLFKDKKRHIPQDSKVQNKYLTHRRCSKNKVIFNCVAAL